MKGRKGKTDVDVSLDVSDEDEVAGASVADVGVDGDRASRVSLDRVWQPGGVGAGDGGVGEAACTVDERARHWSGCPV